MVKNQPIMKNDFALLLPLSRFKYSYPITT